MMPYVWISVLLLLFAWIYDIHHVTMGKRMAGLLSFAVLWLLVGLRYRMGGDGVFYQDTFYETPSLLDVLARRETSRFQPFWLLMIDICHNYYVFQMLHGFIVTACFFRFFKKRDGMVFLPMALLFLSGLYLYFTIEVQREVLSVCILLLNVDNLNRRRLVPYYAWTLVALMFHVSAVIMLLLPLLRTVRFDGRYAMAVLVGMAVFMVIKPVLFHLVAILMPFPALRERILVYAPLQFGLLHSLFFFVVRVCFLVPLLFSMPDEPDWVKAGALLVAAFSLPIPVFERFLNYFYPILIGGLAKVICQRTRYLSLNRLVALTTAAVMFFCIIDRKIVFTHSPDGARYSSLFIPYVSVLHPYDVQERYDFYEGVMSEQDRMLYGSEYKKEKEKNKVKKKK